MATDPFSALSQGFLQGFQVSRGAKQDKEDRKLKLQQFAMDKAQNEATLAAQKAKLQADKEKAAMNAFGKALDIYKQFPNNTDMQNQALGVVNKITNGALGEDFSFLAQDPELTKKAMAELTDVYQGATGVNNNGVISIPREELPILTSKLKNKYKALFDQKHVGVTGLSDRIDEIFDTGAELDKTRKEEEVKSEFDSSSTPDTDIDDFVRDAELARAGDEKAALRNLDRLQIKRPQAAEVQGTALAKKLVEAKTAETIAFNKKMGDRLAEIETAPDLIKARGETTPIEKKTNAQKSVSGKISSMARAYLSLDAMGAIVSVDRNAMDNISARMSSSAIGQAYGNAIGTDAQSQRNKIESTRPLLMNDIRQASEMGARGLDSEKELEFYLKAATDPTREIKSQIAAMIVLDEAYGNGDAAKLLRSKIGDAEVDAIMNEAGTTVERTFTETEAPPTEGAKRAPDGNWYVETEPGKFSRVVE